MLRWLWEQVSTWSVLFLQYIGSLELWRGSNLCTLWLCGPSSWRLQRKVCFAPLAAWPVYCDQALMKPELSLSSCSTGTLVPLWIGQTAPEWKEFTTGQSRAVLLIQRSKCESANSGETSWCWSYPEQRGWLLVKSSMILMKLCNSSSTSTELCIKPPQCYCSPS